MLLSLNKDTMHLYRKMNEVELGYFHAGSALRAYGEKTAQPNYGFLDHFYSAPEARLVDGRAHDFIIFRRRSQWVTLVGHTPPADIDIDTTEDRVLEALMVGIFGGQDRWNLGVSESTGEAVRKARTAKGWTLQELADASGQTKGNISDIENGRGSEPTRARLEKIMGAMGYEVHFSATL